MLLSSVSTNESNNQEEEEEEEKNTGDEIVKEIGWNYLLISIGIIIVFCSMYQGSRTNQSH